MLVSFLITLSPISSFIGAPRSVSVLSTLKILYLEYQTRLPRPSPSKFCFRLVDHFYPSIETNNLKLEIPTVLPSISVVFNDVSSDVHHILGLGILSGDNLHFDTFLNHLKKRTIIRGEDSSPTYEIDYCPMPMKFVVTHVFLQMKKPHK